MKSRILQEISDKGIKTLNEYEARKVVEEYGISAPKEVLIKYERNKDGDDYLSEFKEMEGRPDYPIYLKVVSRDILSKTDAGAIKRVNSDSEAAMAMDEILANVRKYDEKAEIDGILASEDVSNDTREMILGSATDPQFGNLISLGVGGIYVEVYGDVEFGIVPLAESDVYGMIENLQGKELLGEFRGMEPVDVESLVENTLRFSKLIEENPEIEEADINPLLVGPKEIIAADTLIRL